MAEATQRGNWMEVLLAFLRLGCTSFGGPVAHLGYFRRELVTRRGWLTEEVFAETVALAQSLPGPSSSQVGYAIGLQRAGIGGGIAAWCGFTLPSAIVMVLLASSTEVLKHPAVSALAHALQLVAVAVVAQAVWQMRQSLAPDARRMVLAAAVVGIVFFAPAAFGTVLAIVLSGIAGGLFLGGSTANASMHGAAISQRTGWIATAVMILLCCVASIPLATLPESHSVFASFFRAGALVFGGGHVVLPLLQASVVSRGWVPLDLFLAGYGAAQALPGPLFTSAAFLGAAIRPSAHPAVNALLALSGIFLPGLLLMTAVMPVWSRLRRQPKIMAALAGINAGVVGILAAALYRPVWIDTVRTTTDAVIAIAAFALLTWRRMPPWLILLLVVATSGLATWVQHPGR